MFTSFMRDHNNNNNNRNYRTGQLQSEANFENPKGRSPLVAFGFGFAKKYKHHIYEKKKKKREMCVLTTHSVMRDTIFIVFNLLFI